MSIYCSAMKYWVSLLSITLIILVTLVVTFIRGRGQVDGFPCSTKGLLVDTLPSLSLSILPTLAQAAQPSHHLKVLDFFPPYISYLEWGLGNLGRCIGKSNIFCARVLWTEILALNWIRCRRSNSKTMKRENSEAKPLLKWLSRKIKQFQKPTFSPLCQCLRI